MHYSSYFSIFTLLTVFSLPVASQDHRYYNGEKELLVERPRNQDPVTFNGFPIASTELDASEIHAIAPLDKGHHFGHENWRIAEKNGTYVWEYKELVRRANKRQIDEIFDFLTLESPTTTADLSDFAIPEETLIEVNTLASDVTSVISISWEESLDIALDMFDGGNNIVAGSTALSGFLDNFFAVSLELFVL